MDFCSIASGSSGNCIYVGSDQTSVLIDTGISRKRIVDGLHEIDRKPEELKGILITHEHSDHIKGLGVMSRKYHIPSMRQQVRSTGSETVPALVRLMRICSIRSGDGNFRSKIWRWNRLPYRTMPPSRLPIVWTMERNRLPL